MYVTAKAPGVALDIFDGVQWSITRFAERHRFDHNDQLLAVMAPEPPEHRFALQ